jgi:hypothetical protein
MQDRGRQVVTEQDMLNEFPFNWDKNGAMTIKGMDKIFQTPKFMMLHRFGDTSDLDRIITKLSSNSFKALEAFPIVVGYNDPDAGGNHIAVLCEFDPDPSHRKFIVMDPGKGYRTRTREYLASQKMIFGWPKEAGDIIYG